ncbi:hypothetical protein KR054_012576 [Drosophila jambulina]|nr:hypothetical protein KR054_012576 [Drosophila jambulina]
MGSSTGSWILLGLVASVASLANAASIQRSDGQSIYQSNGNTYLSNGAGQIIRRADGKTVLIGSDGNQIVTSDEDDSLDFDSSSGGSYNSHNNVIINGKNSFYQGNGGGSFINSNGRTVRIINGVLELTENGQVYTFQPKEKSVNQKETVTINGQPAQVEYSNGDVIVELTDHTVVAKVGDNSFVGDRNSFDNREKLVAEAHEDAHRIQKEVHENLKKTMEELHTQLQSTFGNIFQ